MINLNLKYYCNNCRNLILEIQIVKANDYLLSDEIYPTGAGM